VPSGGLSAVVSAIAILASILYRVSSKTAGGYSVALRDRPVASTFFL